MRDTSNVCLRTWLHEILFKLNRIFNPCPMTKGRRYAILWNNLNYHWSLKLNWSFCSDEKWSNNLETYKNIKTMHCSKTGINLDRFLDFANTRDRILAKTCPALSWDQAMLSFSWVNRFQASKANRKVSHLMQYLCTGITCAWESNVIIYCCITCMCIHVITVTSRTLNSTPGPSRPHSMHIGRENMGISRMRTDREKSRHTVNKVPLTKFSKIRLRAPLVARNKNAESNLCKWRPIFTVDQRKTISWSTLLHYLHYLCFLNCTICSGRHFRMNKYLLNNTKFKFFTHVKRMNNKTTEVIPASVM